MVQRTGWGKSAAYFNAARLLRDPGAGPTDAHGRDGTGDRPGRRRLLIRAACPGKPLRYRIEPEREDASTTQEEDDQPSVFHPER